MPASTGIIPRRPFAGRQPRSAEAWPARNAVGTGARAAPAGRGTTARYSLRPDSPPLPCGKGSRTADLLDNLIVELAA